MRRATCTAPLQLSVLGTRGSVQIAQGSEVDLDQVMGEQDDRPVTLEEALGPHLVHFAIERPAPPVVRNRMVTKAPAVASSEE